MSGFDVDSEQLRWHASTVARIADQLSGVASRAPDRLAGGALGTFAQFLTGGLSGALAQAGAAISDISTSVDRMSAAIRQTAQGYAHTDDHSANRFTQEYPR